MGQRAAVSLYLRDLQACKKILWGWARLRLGPQQRAGLRGRRAPQIQEGIPGQGPFAPTGTKDYSPYITKITPVRRRRGLPWCCRATTTTAFPLAGAAVPPCPRRSSLLTEIVDLAQQSAPVGDCVARADRLLALQLQLRSPVEQRVRRLVEEGTWHPFRHFRGRGSGSGMKVFEAGITKGRGGHRGRQAAPGRSRTSRSRASRARCS